MPTIVHIVGDADLGLPQGSSRLNFLNQLYEQTIASDRASLLLSAHRDEQHHNQMSPIESLLAHLQILAPDLADGRRWDLVLIATAQDPPHEGDSEPIARLMAEVLDDDPSAFGYPVRPVVLLVDAMSIDAFARTTADYAKSTFVPKPVMYGIAGGPTNGSIGVMGGLLAAGLRPRLFEANRQDLDLELDFAELTMDADIAAWCARTRQYETLARLVEGDDKQLAKALDEAAHAEWPATRSKITYASEAHKRIAAALDLPRDKHGNILKNLRSDSERQSVAAALRRVIVAGVSNDDPTAPVFVQSYLRTQVDALAAEHAEDVSIARNVVRADFIAQQFLNRARNVGNQLNLQGRAKDLLEENPQATPRDFGAAFTDSIREKLEEAAKRAISEFADADAFGVVFNHLFTNSPDRLPESLRPLLSPANTQLQNLGREARHGLSRNHLLQLKEVLVEGGITEDDGTEAAALKMIGHTPPPRLGASGQLIIFVVGKRVSGEDDPVVESIISHAESKGPTTFIVIASGDTREVAEAIIERLNSVEESTPVLCLCDDPFSTVSTHEKLKSVIRSVDARDIVDVEVLIGPGTKALNVGMVMASMEIAFELAASFSLSSVLPERTEDGTIDHSRSRIVPALQGTDGWLRLIDDDTVARMITSALERLDLGTLERVLARSSQQWSGVSELVRLFRVLLENSMTPEDEALRLAMTQLGLPDNYTEASKILLASRIQQLSSLEVARCRAAALRSAVTLSDYFPDNTRDGWPANGSARELWDRRNAAKSLTDPVGELPELRGLVRDLGLPWCDPWPLADLRRRIKEAVRLITTEQSNVRLVNLTPHPVTILTSDGPLLIGVDGPAPRVELERIDLEPVISAGHTIPFGVSITAGEIRNLPKTEEGHLFIVSRMVAEAVPERNDLVFPDELVRNDQGAVIGCRRLSRIVASDEAD